MVNLSETVYRDIIEKAIEGQLPVKEDLWYSINLRVSRYLGAEASHQAVMGNPPPEYPYILHLQQVLRQNAKFSFDPLRVASEVVNRVIANAPPQS